MNYVLPVSGLESFILGKKSAFATYSSSPKSPASIFMTSTSSQLHKQFFTQMTDCPFGKSNIRDGYQNISKWLNIPGSPVKSTIKKWKEYSSAVNLSQADCPHERWGLGVDESESKILIQQRLFTARLGKGAVSLLAVHIRLDSGLEKNNGEEKLPQSAQRLFNTV